MNSKISIKNIVTQFYCISYGLLISNLTDILGYTADEISDRNDYLNHFIFPTYLIGNYINGGIIELFVNNPFYYLLTYIMGLIITPTLGVKILMFISSYLVSYITLTVKNSSFIYNLFILFNASLILSMIGGIRNGLACSIFYFAYINSKGIYKRILFFISILIHNSLFIVYLIMVISNFLSVIKTDFRKKILGFILIINLFILTLEPIAKILKVDSARYIFSFKASGSEQTGLGFILWFLVLITLIWKRSESFKNLPIYNFSVTTIIFYLSSYFLLPFSSRILESSNLLILLSTNYIFKSQRILITILIATQTIYLYFFKWENLLLL